MTGKNFKRKRIAMGFPTQQSCADAMGIRQEAISQWETGKNPIPLWAVKTIELIERISILEAHAKVVIPSKSLSGLKPEDVKYLR